MFGASVRMLFGFVLACLAAGFTQVMFAFGTGEFGSGDPNRISVMLRLIASAATQSAVFSAAFALISAVVAEWQDIRGWLYHAVAGVAIAGAGFAAQYSSEAPGAPSVFNNYATVAYLVTGLVAGSVYWLFAGRHAGSRGSTSEATSTPAKALAAPPK